MSTLKTYTHTFIAVTLAKRQKLHASISRQMDKQNAVYINNGTLFVFRREGNYDVCYNMDEPWGFFAKLKMPDPDTNGHIFYDSIYMM